MLTKRSKRLADDVASLPGSTSRALVFLVVNSLEVHGLLELL
jgi:hypothetical protein